MALDNTQRTFRAEILRAVPAGILESAGVVFAMYVAVNVFDSAAWTKSLIFSIFGLGLIASMFVVPVVIRLKLKVVATAAAIHVIAGGGYLFAAVMHQNEIAFLSGIYLATFISPLALPLQTMWYRQHYPDSRRGKLFASTTVIKASFNMATGVLGGLWLDKNLDHFQTMFYVFFALEVCVGAAIMMIDEPVMNRGEGLSKPPRIFHAMHWIKDDPVFARVILSMMAMGIGMLMLAPQKVDYLSNERYGLVFDAFHVGLLAATLPSAARIVTTFFWGWLFDRISFFRMRAIVNVIFGISLFVFFMGRDIWVIGAAAVFFGIARGGGEILWNLFVTKLAAPEHAGEYMGVHTFFTGIRSVISPIAGFQIAALLSIGNAVTISMGFIAGSIVILWPLLKSGTTKNVSSP